MRKTAMQELLEYVKTTNAITFLPDQLAKTIEDRYLSKSARDVKIAFIDGELNVWNRERDGNILEYQDQQDYFNKKLSEVLDNINEKFEFLFIILYKFSYFLFML